MPNAERLAASQQRAMVIELPMQGGDKEMECISLSTHSGSVPALAWLRSGFALHDQNGYIHGAAFENVMIL